MLFQSPKFFRNLLALILLLSLFISKLNGNSNKKGIKYSLQDNKIALDGTKDVRIPITISKIQKVPLVDKSGNTTFLIKKQEQNKHILRGELKKSNTFYIKDWIITITPFDLNKKINNNSFSHEIILFFDKNNKNLGKIRSKGYLKQYKNSYLFIGDTSVKISAKKDEIFEISLGFKDKKNYFPKEISKVLDF